MVTGARYCSAVQSARVGLCLSDVEGPMRASIEYALLGLPVISTSATGGRVEFMDQTHGRVVPPDADAIARAVAELTRDRTPAEVVTAAALSRLARERARFGEIAREWTTRLFSGPVSGVGDTHPRTWGLWTTRSASVISAMMPPSPELSTRIMKVAYLTETTMISAQKNNDRLPRMFASMTGIA